MLEIIPLGPALGAEIRGINIGQNPSEDQLDQIKSAWQQYLVLVFRQQNINDRQLLSFSRLFGELDSPGPNPLGEPFHKQHPEINVISNIIKAGIPQGNLGAGEAVWHADMTYLEQPPKAGILYSLEIPPAGGNTYFANMYAAYAALSGELKQQIHDKVAIHDASHNSAGIRRKGYSEITDVRKTPGAHHPLLRTNPANGQKALFLGRRPHSYILGLDVEQSETLLDTLWQHITQERFSMSHTWQTGDLLMWDNLSVLHRRDAFDSSARRRLHRTQLKGQEVIA